MLAKLLIIGLAVVFVVVPVVIAVVRQKRKYSSHSMWHESRNADGTIHREKINVGNELA